MKKITFITGNPKKAEYLEKYLGFSVSHKKVDLIEIQSLDLYEIVEHKVREAYKTIQGPVLVEDASLEFRALGRLPGTFIKFFLEEMSEETICWLLDGKEKWAIAKTVYGYFDGKRLEFFEAQYSGIISEKPKGTNGYGWDRIFIPEGYSETRAEMNEKDHAKNYLEIKPLGKVKKFLESL
jgi:non-canonical purine NTP pyrophosphatase (RdgB/HAM1 family)